MPLYQVNAGDRELAADLNQYYNLLKGVAASGEAITLIYNGTSLIFQPSSDPSAGTRVLDIKNAAGTHLASLDFNGVLELLAAAAAPGGAVAGAAYFDTLFNALRVYDGTNWNTLGAAVAPNLVLNSDFGRRTVFGLAMPEVFADTSGYGRIDGAAPPTVASNILTQAATTNQEQYPASKPGNFWRDGRFSATFKAVSTTGQYIMRAHYADANNFVQANTDGAGNFLLRKLIGGSATTVATVAQALTLNRWYWFELEAQGTTWIAKMYDTGGTASGVTKASSTLLQTLTGTISDAGVTAGDLTISSDQSNAQWGGIATGNGGVYVETWLPESWTITHTGTLGGQAIGYDELADSGPINKQWTPVVYIPATSRTMTVQYSGPDGGMQASTAYDFSYYLKNTSLGGSGVMIRGNVLEQNSASATQATNSQDDAAETSFTRKSATFTTNAATRRFAFQFLINQGGARTGTVRFSLPQVELGSAATAWRNAPADDAPITWELRRTTVADPTTTSATLVEIDSRDLAGNLFLPWDAVLTLDFSASVYQNTAAADSRLSATTDAANVAVSYLQVTRNQNAAAAQPMPANFSTRKTAAAGKHRIAATWAASAGTTSLFTSSGADAVLRVTGYRGK